MATRARTNEEAQAAISAGKAYLETAWGRKQVKAYRHDTGWAITGEGFSQRSFMVCLSDIWVEAETLDEINDKIGRAEAAEALLESQQAECPKRETAEVLMNQRVNLLTLRDRRNEILTGGQIRFVAPTCKYCGKPSDRAVNVCSRCNYGVR